MTDHSETEGADKGETLHEHACGEITERPGKVNKWLIPVYLILFVWSFYYVITYWGGLGPGLDY